MSDALGLEIEASLAGLAGATAEAIAKFGEARDAWRRIGLPWDEALLGLDMATVLDPTIPEVEDAVSRSRAILVELGGTAVRRPAGGCHGHGPARRMGGHRMLADAEPITVAESEVAAS